jgi:hypothetical protein
MSRLLHLPFALATRIELRPSHMGRKKLLMIGLAVGVVLGATLLVSRAWWPGGVFSGVRSKTPAALGAGLRAARARAIADLRARNSNHTSRPAQVALIRTRTADVSHTAALFATHSWYVAPPPPPPPPPAPAASLAPPVPTAPPLPFQYIGSYKPDGEAQVFFLTHDDRVYDARVGDTLENTYSIDGFNGSQLLLTYKPLNIQQQLMVGSIQ